ncbi:nitrogen permease regulator of amino acid transport activity 3-domain-containing protein [Glomus cerebriforme]|uniref:Nitrogen permease regulator 3 n=1 Tax=Glomus cerebriforme TaxID=658196 RepID=A0A397ST88_9GLOM|nr:nitrogen permease regulator of amino acid transport activity 3-domain-containing protein [Glomus cerebriforme]
MVNLLAILLVTSSSGGSHFVFHYPKVPQRRDEIEQARRENDLDEEFGDDLLENDVITWPYGLTEDFDNWSLRSRLEEDNEDYDFNSKKQANNNTGNDEIEYNEMNKLFGFETRLLADMFCPKHKDLTKFQLSVDDLTFVGQPVFLNSNIDTKKRGIYSRGRDLRKKIDDNDNSTNLDDDEGLQEQLSDTQNEEMSKISSSVASDHSNASSTHSMQQHQYSTFFHLVFVLEPPELELCRQVDDIYNNIISKLTSALRYEQLRCGYVRKEAELMLSLRENSGISTLDELMEITLEKSSLARTIRKVYDAISNDCVAHILINDYIDLSLQIPPLVPTINFSDNDMIGHEYSHYPVIAPYHTLLLLEDPEEILKNMPLDANPTLVQLVQILTPTQRLADLCTLLDCSLAQMFRLAAHLIYWRKAKIIDVINLRNVYVVSPTADMNLLPTYIEYFKQHFPNLDLVRILDSFSTLRPQVLMVNKEIRTMYLEAITYLLRNDVVVQLHAYILVMIPQYIKKGYTQAEYEEKLRNSGDSEGHGLASSMDDTAIISPFEKASDNETEWLNNFVSNQPKETVALFKRLIKYFNGKHHVDEILFRESLKPRDLSKILKLFNKDQLLIVLC